MSDLLIQDVDVLQCEDGSCRILRDSDILICGNRIEAILPADRRGDRGARDVLPGVGMLAVPGLINTHAHVPMGIFRGLAEDVDISTSVVPTISRLMIRPPTWSIQYGRRTSKR